MYREATKEVVGRVEPRTPDDLNSTIDALRSPTSPLPLFKFVVNLAAEADEATHDQLWAWLDEVAPWWEVTPARLREFDNALHRSFVLVRLVPDLLGGGWLVTGWIYAGREGRQILCSEEPWDRPRLAAELGRVLRRMGAADDQGGNATDDSVPRPVIEFQVPLSMMEEHWETLRITVAGTYREIGADFPVVVRALDRLADADSHLPWLALWNKLSARGDAYDEDLIGWFDDASPLSSHEPRLAEICVCAALTRIQPADIWPRADLQVLIKAGIPVAVWHRSSDTRPTRRDALEDVLLARGLLCLPDRVRALRNAARTNTSHQHSGRELVLLWDDPLRIPAEPLWRPPTGVGVSP